MTDKALLQECYDQLRIMFNPDVPLMQKLTARLAQPEPEPVAWMHDSNVGFNVPLYTAPPQREWQGLTDEEIGEIIEASQITLKNYCSEDKQTEYARAIEAKLKEKNAPASPS